MNEGNTDSFTDAPESPETEPETGEIREKARDGKAPEGTEDITSAEPVTGQLISETETEPVPQDISGSLAAVFVLSMILGLLLFDTLSKRWHT